MAFDLGRRSSEPRERLGEIEEIVASKSALAPKYREYCDEIWLVISAAGGNVLGDIRIEEDEVAPEIGAAFDRAFLVSSFSGRVLEFAIRK